MASQFSREVQPSISTPAAPSLNDPKLHTSQPKADCLSLEARNEARVSSYPCIFRSCIQTEDLNVVKPRRYLGLSPLIALNLVCEICNEGRLIIGRVCQMAMTSGRP